MLYLLTQELLDIPVLYMSRHIVRTKSDYHRLLQAVREKDAWENWVTYMLSAVEASARDGITMVLGIKRVLLETKHRIRSEHRKIYSQDLINSLFTHPYTKIQFIERDLDVSRITATKYLNALATSVILVRRKVGRRTSWCSVTDLDKHFSRFEKCDHARPRHAQKIAEVEL